MQESREVAKEIAKKKFLTVVIASLPGFLPVLLGVFVIFIAICVVLGLFDFDSSSSSSGMYSQECGFTISRTSLSKAEFKEKIKKYSEINNDFKIFYTNAEGIYDYAKSKNVNPELVVVRAKVEGKSAENNYWGMGCTNTGGITACFPYSTFREGYIDFIENISQYDSLKDMMSKYAYIGAYWYNPGGSGLGGCYYHTYIYSESNMPSTVRQACRIGAPLCSKDNTNGCTATTKEDQEAYAAYQVSLMAEIRQEIFGLSQTEGPCDRVSNCMGSEEVINQEYAANAFIYEAKKRKWKDNAIQGVLAYMLAEGLQSMGTFTYESYYLESVKGPSGFVRDATLDNKAWLEWIETDGIRQMRATSYTNRTDIYAAFGLGLLADSDVWNAYHQKTVSNATALIEYAESKGKPWQDPETQLTYYFEKIFTRETVFDEKGIDPTKDNRSPEEWCRRILAGYGMSGWSWQTKNDVMNRHIAKLAQAKEYLDKYNGNFKYKELCNQKDTGEPNFTNTDAWITKNAYIRTKDKTALEYGQCTWFAWGRFYEIYGYDPGFWGNGKDCVGQLLAANGDKFYKSETPKAGAVFSCSCVFDTNGYCDPTYGHVGIVKDFDGNNITVQDGNLDGKYNNFEDATKDWREQTFGINLFKSYICPGAIYANPK